jgi:serine/threonine protein phosphatase 1
MTRTIVIGDLHGCYHEALDLLDKLAVTQTDRVIFTGDLVDRGPFPSECVELAMQHESILGNHEEKHLQQRNRRDADLLPDHLQTRRALQPRHYEYFKTLPTFIRLPEHNAAVIHAGAFPKLTLEEQPEHTLLHGQCIQPTSGTHKSYWPSKAPVGWRFWTTYWKGPERLIFGHTVLDKPLVSKYAVGIDTGAVFGRGLTAVVLPDWEIVSVPSRKNYYEKRRVDDARLFPVMDGVSTFS